MKRYSWKTKNNNVYVYIEMKGFCFYLKQNKYVYISMKGFCFYLKVKLNQNGFQKFKIQT